MKWSVILADRFGPEILRAHMKVSGWLSDLNALLTRKLPMFLSVRMKYVKCVKSEV